MSNLAARFDRAPGHVQRVAESFAGPSGDRIWCVCRFVGHLDTDVWPAVRGPARFGWPLRGLANPYGGPMGWSKDDPVCFFAHEEAQRAADEDNARHQPDAISFDAPVLVTSIRWTVRLLSHYDGSEIVGETDDYHEAIRAFTAAQGVAARENTPTVRYLVASLDGRCEPVGAPRLAAGALGLEMPE